MLPLSSRHSGTQAVNVTIPFLLMLAQQRSKALFPPQVLSESAKRTVTDPQVAAATYDMVCMTPLR
jgi:hypothetical protein